jgi:F-type H+-transporting ATPase subunit a
LGKFVRLDNLRKGNFLQVPIDLFVGVLELLSEFVRIVSFTFRLFGNMTAGEIVLLVITYLVPFVAVVVFYGLELLVGLVQALIFAGLTLVFAAIAMTAHEEHEEH